MILRDLDNDTINNLNLGITNIPSINWNYYYEQYKNVLVFLVCNEECMNARYMSFLFIFRHTVELFLKEKISTQEKTHSLTELYGKTENLPNNFLEHLEILRCSGDGGDFRYLTNKNGESYFNGEILHILPPLKYFFNLSNINQELPNRPRGFYEIHTNSFLRIGHICTDYDESIYLMIQGVKNNRININNIFLPLLFLIRHTIELSLKQNLLDAGERYLDKKKISNINNEHSICRLFNIFNDIVSKALEKMDKNNNKDPEFQEQTINYRAELNNLKDIVHDLDNNSYYFRFPTDRNGMPHNLKITENKIRKILQLREKTNAYLTFAIPVLKKYGFLEYNDDELFQLI